MIPVGSAVAQCPRKKDNKPKHWIEIELVGEDGQPIPWEEYLVILPNGAPAPGYLDQDGFARLDNIDPGGTCRISFPKLDQDAWETLDSLGPKEPSPATPA